MRVARQLLSDRSAARGRAVLCQPAGRPLRSTARSIRCNTEMRKSASAHDRPAQHPFRPGYRHLRRHGPAPAMEASVDRISAALPRPALCRLETTAAQKRSSGVMDSTISIGMLARSNSPGSLIRSP